MDGRHFDAWTRSLSAARSRRGLTGLLATLMLAGPLARLDLAETAAKKRRKGKKGKKGKKKRSRCHGCGPCESCQGGRCTPKANGAACGPCKKCQSGRCVSSCPAGQSCQGGTCTCPPGTKNCAGNCISQNQCCGTCPGNEECCTNVGECKDVRNDSAFCGQCVNGQCPGGAFCANGKCGLTCTTPGGTSPCFAPNCFCSTRVDPAHNGQNVCASRIAADCDAADQCAKDADCAPGTLGFREVCVSNLCTGKNVCASPCA